MFTRDLLIINQLTNLTKFSLSFSCEKNNVAVNGTNENVTFLISSVSGAYSRHSSIFTQKLLIQDSNLMYLPNQISKFFPFIQHFGVIASHLVYIKRENFNNLEILKSLDLRRNRLMSFPENVFIDLVNLRKIDLSGNYITVLPSTAFATMRLLERFIANENLITRFESIIFRNSDNLNEIHLWKNRIKSIEYDVKVFRKLVMFDVRENVCINALFYLTTEDLAFATLQKEIIQKCNRTMN